MPSMRPRCPACSSLQADHQGRVQAYFCASLPPLQNLHAGMVERPCELSMQELTERFKEHALLATLSCAGNRCG